MNQLFSSTAVQPQGNMENRGRRKTDIPDVPRRPVPRPGGPAAVLIDRTINQIATVLGRLSYLASLRDPLTGRYRHPVFEKLAGARTADMMLRATHGDVFHQWLSLNLHQQRGDLTRYLGYQTFEDDALVRRVRDSQALDDLPPGEIANHERELFTSALPAIFHSVLSDLGR